VTTLRSLDPRRTAVSALLILGLVLTGLAEYTVRRGDTLWALSRRFGVSVASIAQANNLSNVDLIYAGDKLIIPDGASRPGGGGATYIVRPGETTSIIAKRFGITPSAIAAANKLDNPDRLTAGQRLVLPGDWGPRPAASRAQVGKMLEQTAARYNWSPDIIKALATVESGWNNSVVSDAGAIGIMQVLPGTGHFVSKHLVKRNLDLRDPADNIEAGVAFLDYLYRYTGRDVRHTLGGYYQGLSSIRKNGMYASTNHYVDLILSVRRRY
jgi:LysM repeat protein